MFTVVLRVKCKSLIIRIDNENESVKGGKEADGLRVSSEGGASRGISCHIFTV